MHKRLCAAFLCSACLGLNGAALAGAYDDILSAAQNGRVDVVLDLVARGMDVNTTDADGSTLLLIAARGDNQKLVEALLHNRASVIKRNRFGDTALHVAASQGHAACVALLLAAGSETDPAGWTALHYAAYAGHTATVELLIAKGAKLDARAPNGRTALMLAAQNDHAGVSLALLRAGADTELQDYDGKTAEAILATVAKLPDTRAPK